jgi:putative transposase
VRFAFIAPHRTIWQTQQMCETLGVSRAGFYEWLGRPEGDRAKANRELLAVIRDSFAPSDQTYGSPRVWRDLIAWGYRCSENRVARLMLAAQAAVRHRRTTRGLDCTECTRSAICGHGAEPAMGRRLHILLEG